MNVDSASELRAIPTVLFIPNGLFRLGIQSLLSQSVCKVLDHDPELSDLDPILEELSDVGSIVIFVESSSDNPGSLVNINKARSLFVDGKIIVLAGNPNEEHLRDCFLAGANAYILPDATLEILNDSIRLVLAGQYVLPGKIAPLFARKEKDDVRIAESDLSETECRILRMLVAGLTNKEMQKYLRMEDNRLKYCLRKLLEKIGAANRVQGAIWAEKNGMPAFDPSIDSADIVEPGWVGARELIAGRDVKRSRQIA